ncbi:MAG: thymidine kinase [Nanoarchaeota archaeon]
MQFNPTIKPGILEVYCGPMNSGKSRELVHRIDKLSFMQGYDFIIFKPEVDKRNGKQICTRFGNLCFNCEFIDEKDPEKILNKVTDKHHLVVIDEAQFFSKEIVEVIQMLQLRGKNVLVAGLDLDFKGDVFGAMGKILAIADEVHKLTGICQIPGCCLPATRSQRLIDGEPAKRDSPLVLIGDKKEGYECRCLKHHVIRF